MQGMSRCCLLGSYQFQLAILAGPADVNGREHRSPRAVGLSLDSSPARATIAARFLFGILIWDADAVFPALVQASDGDSAVLGDEADELLPNVLDLVVLPQAADVRLHCVLRWLAGLANMLADLPG